MHQPIQNTPPSIHPIHLLLPLLNSDWADHLNRFDVVPQLLQLRASREYLAKEERCSNRCTLMDTWTDGHIEALQL